MSREILFRGKPKDNSSYEQEWVYGVPVPVEYNTYPTGRIDLVKSVNYNKLDGFIPSWEVCNCEIKPETLGEYTGLKDRNGNRIFEGDIVRIAKNGTRNLKTYSIDFVHEIGMYVIHSHKDMEDDRDFTTTSDYELEVVGNVHDNPELMEGVMKDD